MRFLNLMTTCMLCFCGFLMLVRVQPPVLLILTGAYWSTAENECSIYFCWSNVCWNLQCTAVCFVSCRHEWARAGVSHSTGKRHWQNNALLVLAFLWDLLKWRNIWRNTASALQKMLKKMTRGSSVVWTFLFIIFLVLFFSFFALRNKCLQMSYE